MFKSKYKRIIEIFLFIILLASLYPMVKLAFFSRPCVDDFAYSYITHNYVKSGKWNLFGLLAKAFETYLKFYNTWQRLYSSAFILALQPGIFGEKYYCIGMFILLIFSYFSFLYFVKTISDILKLKVNKYLLSMFVFVITIQALPSALSGLYWYNGAYNYMPFFFLALLNVSVCLKYLYCLNERRYLIISCLLSFIISGGNHVTAFLNILLLICLCFIAYKKGKKYLVVSLAVAIFGFIIVMIAPGTKIRQGDTMQPVLITILMSFVQSFKYIYTWIDKKTIFIFLATILWSIYTFNNNSINNLKISPFILFFISWVILCGMLCVPYIAMGFFGAERLTNVVWLFFIVSTNLLIIYTTWYLMNKYISVRVVDQTISFKLITVILALMCVFYTSSNSFKAFQEVYNCTAPLYAQSFDKRIEIMNSTKNNSKIIVVDALPYSAMLRIDDLTDDISDWRNTSWEDYYGYKMIAIYK